MIGAEAGTGSDGGGPCEVRVSRGALSPFPAPHSPQFDAAPELA